MNTRHLLRKVGGAVLGALLVSGALVSAGTTAQAQARGGRRIVIVRPYRVYRPFGWGTGYYRRPFGYPYGWDTYYSQYVFRDGESAASQGYKDGLKTGEADGRKRKSYSPERSHYYHDAGFGNFGEVYRSAFSRGYGDGFNRAHVG